MALNLRSCEDFNCLYVITAKIGRLNCVYHSYPTRKEVQAANEARLMTLASPEHTYKASDEPGLDDAGNPVSTERAKTILNRLVVPEEITLKVCLRDDP